MSLKAGERPAGSSRPKRNPSATRRALLEAARQEFAAKGLAGGRVDEIAARAGVNKQLVYHHFGDKAGLYLTVLEGLYQEIRTREHALELEGLAPEAAIRKLTEASFDHLADHPDFVALLTDENRHGAVHIKGSTRLTAMHSPFVELIRETLRKGEEAGVFRAGIDPLQLYISIAGLAFFFFSNTPTLSAIFDTDLSQAKAIKDRRAHVVDLVMNALRP
ncbi:TetR/AcrR family transcriptional regulator [Mangrovicella endophytica]|uniref:TetR/AcrR family transcriptional regulator n=1 Tax=Mangrovicella endophytica TaxID=2066697 RepID=UPI000C9E88DE|nr:TetR/AcrR family transcriptional regulator [Mangrovicella endophytica]